MTEYSHNYPYWAEPEIPNDYMEDFQCPSCGQYFDGSESIGIAGEVLCGDCSRATNNSSDDDDDVPRLCLPHSTSVPASHDEDQDLTRGGPAKAVHSAPCTR